MIYSNKVDKKRITTHTLYVVIVVVISSIFMPAIFTQNKNNYNNNDHNAFAQPTQSEVVFRNVAVEGNPVPNKPFQVNATITVSDVLPRHVLLALSVPPRIGVTGSQIIDLGDVSSGDREKMATWTLIASKPGTYALNLTAYSSSVGVIGTQANNFESTPFPFSVSVGSVGSLIVTGMDIPGSIHQNNVFTATIKLKNTGLVPADNVIAQLALPTGLELLNNVASNVASIKAGEEVPLSWNIKSEKPGSFLINATYSSTNAGSGSIQASATVGDLDISNIRPSKIFLAGSELTSSNMGPGDKNLPLNITLVNDGSLPLLNVSAVLQLNEPFFWSYKQGSAITETHAESIHFGSIKSGQSVTAPYFISARSSAKPDTYTNQLRVSFSNLMQQSQQIYDIPISIASNVALSVQATTAKLNPGFYTPIAFSIVNKGEVPLHAIQLLSSGSVTSRQPSFTAGLTTTSVAPTGPYLSIDTPYWVGDLGVGENKTLTLKVYTPNERISQQPLPIMIGYDANGKHETETYMIGVHLEGKPSFQIQKIRAAPSVVYPGDVGTRMDITLLNIGYIIANNVSAVLKLPHGLAPAWGGGNAVSFGRILPNQNITASFFTNINDNVSSSGFPLTLLLKYNNGSTQELGTTFLVAPKAQFELINVADSSQLYVGASNVPLKVTFRNTGNAMAQTITSKFLGGNIVPGVKSPLQTSIGNQEVVGNILPGQVFTSTYIVNVGTTTTGATSGQQAGSIELMWTQTGCDINCFVTQTRQFIQTIPITYHVAEGPNYLFYYDGIPWTYVIVAVIIVVLLIIFLERRRMNRQRIILQEQYRQQQSRIAEEERQPLPIGQSSSGKHEYTMTEEQQHKEEQQYKLQDSGDGRAPIRKGQ